MDADGIKGNGGAIYVTGTNTSVINSNFTNTIADHVGGAAYIAGHNTYITGDSFYKCNSKGTPCSSYFCASAIEP